MDNKKKIFTSKSLKLLKRKLNNINENNPSISDISFINPFQDIYDSIFIKNEDVNINHFKKNKLKNKNYSNLKNKIYNNFYIKNDLLSKIIKNEIDFNDKNNIDKLKILKKNKKNYSNFNDKKKFIKILESKNISNLSNSFLIKKQIKNKKKDIIFLKNNLNIKKHNQNLNRESKSLILKHQPKLCILNRDFNNYYHKAILVMPFYMLKPFKKNIKILILPIWMPFIFKKKNSKLENIQHIKNLFLKNFMNYTIRYKGRDSIIIKTDKFSIYNSGWQIENLLEDRSKNENISQTKISKDTSLNQKMKYKSYWMKIINNLIMCDDLNKVKYIGYYSQIPKYYFKSYKGSKNEIKKIVLKLKIDILYNHKIINNIYYMN